MKQILGLTMTPELKLSLELLQFGALELTDFVHREIEANPILEFDPDWTAPKKPAGQSEAPKKSGPDVSEIEGVLRREQTLQDHIAEQMSFLALPGAEMAIAQALAGNLNKAGYLTASLAEVSGQLGCREEEAEKVLGLLQDFEPAGIFARDLKECLALQLKEKGPEGRDALKLLDHLDALARRDLEALGRKTGLKGSALAEAIKHLRELDPKPGERFTQGDPLQTAVPDVFVRPAKTGYEVELNPETLPRILVSETYSTAFRQKALKPEGKDFLKNCKRRASWLKRALDQRAKTLLSVSELLVAAQPGFFAGGIGDLKPLTYREIAAEADLHESTISRVVANKYLAYRTAVYPLRFFFSSGIPGPGGGPGTSAHAVKHRIKALVAAEAKTKPLSDRALANALAKEGIGISRRTVMKYREALRIPPSFERRETK